MDDSHSSSSHADPDPEPEPASVELVLSAAFMGRGVDYLTK